jgi:hypothetical protein
MIAGALGAAVAAGFVAPPARRRPPGLERGAPIGVVDLDGVPEAFRRYATAAFGEPVPDHETAVIWGRARVRGRRGPWLRARAATYHRLGEAFVGEFPLTWFGIPLAGGRDASVDGQGFSSIFGRRGARTAEADRSANAFMWLEAGLFPSTWRREGVRLEEVDDANVRLWFPPNDEPITWRLGDDGMPYRLEVIRDKVPGEPPVPQWIDLGPWRDVGGFRFFSSATVTWADEGRPWLRWTIDGVEPGADVAATIDHVRATIVEPEAASPTAREPSATRRPPRASETRRPTSSPSATR